MSTAMDTEEGAAEGAKDSSTLPPSSSSCDSQSSTVRDTIAAMRASRWEENSSTSKRRASTEDVRKCSICLSSAMDNECHTDKCAHTFCLLCLQEWAKVKLSCPLCKTEFTCIHHTLTNEGQSEIFTPTPPLTRTEQRRRLRQNQMSAERLEVQRILRTTSMRLAELCQAPAVRRLRDVDNQSTRPIQQRSTNARYDSYTPSLRNAIEAINSRRREHAANQPSSSNAVALVDARDVAQAAATTSTATLEDEIQVAFDRRYDGLTKLQASYNRLLEDSATISREEFIGRPAFRRVVYERNLRALPFTAEQTGGRTREISAHVFNTNNGAVNRLVPFLVRELKAVMVCCGDDNARVHNTQHDKSRVNVVCEQIIEWIKRYPITINGILHTQLFDILLYQTANFISELKSFATSPFNTMAEYDSHVQYRRQGSTVRAVDRSATTLVLGEDGIPTVDGDDDLQVVAESDRVVTARGRRDTFARHRDFRIQEQIVLLNDHRDSSICDQLYDRLQGLSSLVPRFVHGEERPSTIYDAEPDSTSNAVLTLSDDDDGWVEVVPKNRRKQSKTRRMLLNGTMFEGRKEHDATGETSADVAIVDDVPSTSLRRHRYPLVHHDRSSRLHKSLAALTGRHDSVSEEGDVDEPPTTERQRKTKKTPTSRYSLRSSTRSQTRTSAFKHRVGALVEESATTDDGDSDRTQPALNDEAALLSIEPPTVDGGDIMGNLSLNSPFALPPIANNLGEAPNTSSVANELAVTLENMQSFAAQHSAHISPMQIDLVDTSGDVDITVAIDGPPRTPEEVTLSSDSELDLGEVEVLCEMKAKHLRTPPLVDLEDDDEEEIKKPMMPALNAVRPQLTHVSDDNMEESMPLPSTPSSHREMHCRSLPVSAVKTRSMGGNDDVMGSGRRRPRKRDSSRPLSHSPQRKKPKRRGRRKGIRSTKEIEKRRERSKSLPPSASNTLLN